MLSKVSFDKLRFIMIETVKQTLKAGLGATVLTAEKLEDMLQDLVKKGRLSAEEAKEAAQKISEQSKEEFKQTRASLDQLMHEWMDKAPIVRKSDFNQALQQITQLEERISQLESKSVDKAAE